MKVNRCVCRNLSFEKILHHFQNNTLHEIKYGDCCKKCVPYVKQVFETFKTEFNYDKQEPRDNSN